MLLSICIPAYNRPIEIIELLRSVVDQGEHGLNVEVVICEDDSPMRDEIREAVKVFSQSNRIVIKYIENERNLGYDANLRKTIEIATGDFCMFMGNDDLLSPGSLASVVDILDRHPDCGVILRSYSAFAGHRDNIVEEFRYFSEERVFNPGVNSAAILFRRSVVISGMVVNRKSASQIATERYDGSLLYQLYLVARIASCEKAVSTPSCIALYRLGGVPDFGNADCEIGIYVPGEQTVDSSFAFVSGMLSMSEKIEYSIGSPFAALVKRDSAIYSYPFIRIQRGNGYYPGLRMSIKLAQLGFWRSPYFLCYVISLLTIGPVVSDFIIRSIKRAVGHTPMLTKFNE